MKALITVAIVALIAVAFFFGKGCKGDDAVQKELDESRERIEQRDAVIDSLEANRDELTDSLHATLLRVEKSDVARASAEWRTREAIARLNNLPTYETLSGDELAARADSVFRASTGSQADSG